MLDWIRRRREAAHRADALVQRVLSEAERAQLRRNGFLEVLTGHPGFQSTATKIAAENLATH